MTRPTHKQFFLALAILQLMFFSACSDVRAEQKLRIVAFNAQCLAAPGTNDSRLSRYRWDFARTKHLEIVASVIETLNPDILCLSEVTSAPAVEQLIQILHEKGLRKYQGYHVESQDKFTGFDVAFLTKFKPDLIEGEAIRCIYSPTGDDTWRQEYSFTDEEGKQQTRNNGINRNAIFYVTVGDHKLGLLGLHLKSNPDDAYSNGRRTAESQIVGRIIRDELVRRGYTPIVLGDLNDYDPDVPDRDETRSTQTDVLRNIKNYDPSTKQPELYNVGDRIERVADRYTSHWDRNENGVADPEDVHTMIDHILVHDSLKPHVRRAFISRCTDLKTSDHWPVVLDLSLPEKQ